eukprot:1260787-Rhodomonas_salina.2
MRMLMMKQGIARDHDHASSTLCADRRCQECCATHATADARFCCASEDVPTAPTPLTPTSLRASEEPLTEDILPLTSSGAWLTATQAEALAAAVAPHHQHHASDAALHAASDCGSDHESEPGRTKLRNLADSGSDSDSWASPSKAPSDMVLLEPAEWKPERSHHEDHDDDVASTLPPDGFRDQVRGIPSRKPSQQ